MQALTLQPGVANSLALSEFHGPPEDASLVALEAIALGICGTDREIIAGEYGSAPPGSDRLILGHESLARVDRAPGGSGLQPGDLVVPMVRRPDPIPCPNCAVGEWDMCRNGQFTEHGIKQQHGFGCQRFALEPERLVKVDSSLGLNAVLLEPASILAKAWDHIEKIGHRTHWQPRRALVTGAGPIGLLAALLARQRGLEVDVLDRVADGPKPQLVADLGAAYHYQGLDAIKTHPDVVLECTGVPELVFEVMRRTSPGGVACLTGVSSGGRKIAVDFGALNKSIVLENDVVFGTVNANRSHYEAAAKSLAQADAQWLDRLINRRVPLSRWQEAFERNDHDVKVIIEFSSA
jgi:threonine dehydrogenase-like Zn-dependent dehydrogenase